MSQLRRRYKVGDRVRHNGCGREATIIAIRCGKFYTLDFGQSVKWLFGTELNGGEFLPEAFVPFIPSATTTFGEVTARSDY